MWTNIESPKMQSLSILLYPFFFILAVFRALILILSLIIVIPIYIVITKLFIENSPRLAFKIRRAWVGFAQLVLGISYEVTGAPLKDTNALYVSNHRSFSDPVIIASVVDAYVIAKAEVANLPLISTGAEMTGVLYVKRENKDSRNAVRELMNKVLMGNKNVLVFPEGTTKGDINTLPYKKGTFIEAVKHGFTVVPIVLEYKRKKDLWFNSSLFAHHIKQFGRPFTKAKLHFGPAMKNDDGLQLAEAAEKWSNDTIINIHRNWNSDFHHLASRQQTS